MAAAAILKIQSCNVSTTKRPILTTFSTMMSLGLPDTVCQLNFTNLKIQDGGPAHFLKNCKILIPLQPILPKFDMLMSLDPLDPVAQKFGDFKNKRWQWQPLGKSKNRNISALDRQVLKNMWHGDVSHSSQPRQHIKFYAVKNSTWWPIAIWKI